MIDWHKGHFTGRRAVAEKKANDSSLWSMVGLGDEGSIPGDGSQICRDCNTEVGHVTAATWLPAAKRNIALAQVRRPNDRKVEVYVPRVETCQTDVAGARLPAPVLRPRAPSRNPAGKVLTQ